MTYVLIAMTMFQGYVTGVLITTQEFTTKEKCEAAAANINSITAQKYATGTSRYINVFCVEK